MEWPEGCGCPIRVLACAAPMPPLSDRADPTPDLADAALIARARAGDGAAFRRLVERSERVVASTGIGMLGPGDDADDVGQETFVQFHRALDRFRGDATLKTYLVRIAMNLSLNAL